MLGVARDGELLAAQCCRGPAVFPRRQRRDADLAFHRAVPGVGERPGIRPVAHEDGAARLEGAARILLGVVEHAARRDGADRSEEHTSELQSLMRISYSVFCLKKTNTNYTQH